ncbi:FHA domain-containing protein PS1 [Glycine max]|nr:FHA domain-containing protein PS1 [Glycine max]
MASIAAMAENKNPEQEDQARFPILTVLKNNAIVKSIFIVLDDHNEDQMVLIGRHPNCNIVLTHPSVSRFHLRIRSNHSSRTLSLFDLASVHGTWVRGRKLEPGVSAELKEGDTFTVGISTRIYRLSWAPLTQLDDENLELRAEEEIPMPEDIVSLCCDEERKSHAEDEALGVLNGTETSCAPTNSGGENIICDCQLSPPYIQSPPYAQPVDELHNTKKIEACVEVEIPRETNLLCTLREYLKHNIYGTKIQQFQAPHDTFTGQPPSLEMHWSSFPMNIDPTSLHGKDVAAVAVVPTESEFGCTHEDNDKIEGILNTGSRTFNSENTCLIVDEDIPDSEFHQMEVVEEVSVDSVPGGEKQDELHWSSSPTNLDHASLDEKFVAAVAVIPTESEFGCTHGANDKVEDILTTGSRIFNSENTCLIVDKDIPDSEFHQMEVEEISVDSVPDGEKQDECKEEDLNAKSCREEGYSLDEVVEDNGNKCIKTIDPASFDGKGLATVTVIPTESEFGWTLGDNERIEDIL